MKQSIYRFRQAEPSLFLQKAARFDLAERELERRIDLQKNSRSRANVLEAANAVFGRIMRAMRRKSSMTSGKSSSAACLRGKTQDPPVELHILYQPGAETTGGRRGGRGSGNWPPSSGGEGCRRAHS